RVTRSENDEKTSGVTRLAPVEVLSRAPVLEDGDERLGEVDLGVPTGQLDETGVVPDEHRHVDRAEQLGILPRLNRDPRVRDQDLEKLLDLTRYPRADVVDLSGSAIGRQQPVGAN